MKRSKHFIKDMMITVLVMGLCFGAGILMHDVFMIPEQVTTTFAFGVFLVALMTDGYLWGVIASAAGLLLVNYAFTFPYFALDFLIPSNFYSAVVMAIIAVLTSALTTKVKHQEAIKVETEREKCGRIFCALFHMIFGRRSLRYTAHAQRCARTEPG